MSSRLASFPALSYEQEHARTAAALAFINANPLPSELSSTSQSPLAKSMANIAVGKHDLSTVSIASGWSARKAGINTTAYTCKSSHEKHLSACLQPGCSPTDSGTPKVTMKSAPRDGLHPLPPPFGAAKADARNRRIVSEATAISAAQQISMRPESTDKFHRRSGIQRLAKKEQMEANLDGDWNRAKPTLPDDGHSGKTRMPTPQSLLMVAAANVQARLEELDQRILDEKNMTPPAALRGWSTFVRHAQFPQQRWPTRSKKLTKGVNEGGHTEVGWIEADSVRSSLQDVENIAPEGEAQESLKLARPSVNRHGQEAQMREIRVDKRHNALKKQVRHVQASRTVRRGVGTDDGGGGVTILSSKEPPRTKPPSQRVTKPHRTPSQASCDSEPLPLQKPDLRASVADIEMAAHPTIPPPPSGSTSRVRSWGPTSFHNLVPPGEAQGAPTKPESKGLKSIFHKLRRARKTRSEAHIGDKIQFNYEPPNEGAQTSVDHAEVTEMSLPVSQRNSTIRQDSPDEYHSAVSTVSSNSPELPEERGRSLNRISVLSGNSGKTNEVEEARDKFDDRLVPPLTFTSKKAESPGRDSKFHEVFEEPELEVRWKGVDSATRSEASR